MDPVEVIRRSFAFTLKRIDPALRKPKQEKMTTPRFEKFARVRIWQIIRFSDAEFNRIGETLRHRMQRENLIPLALGGTNDLSNMQLLCANHNLLRARN